MVGNLGDLITLFSALSNPENITGGVYTYFLASQVKRMKTLLKLLALLKSTSSLKFIFRSFILDQV